MTRYEQFTMFATHKLKSAYKYKDYINIFPSKVEKQPFKRAKSFTVEISFEHEEPYYRFGTPFLSTFLGNKMLEIMHLLSLFFMYQIPYAEISGNDITGYTNIDLPIHIGEPRFYQNTLFNDLNIEEILIPNDIDLMFEAYLNLNDEKCSVFRNAMYLFYSGVSLEHEYKSFSFLSLVSAIETLMETTFSEKRKIKRKFIEFIKKLSYVDDENYIARLYKKRCDFVHEGHLLLSDRVWDINKDMILGSEEDDYFDRKNLIIITRICIINWLINNYRCENSFILKLEDNK